MVSVSVCFYLLPSLSLPLQLWDIIYDFQQNKLVTGYLYQLSNNINKIEATIWWEKWTQEKTIKIRHQ